MFLNRVKLQQTIVCSVVAAALIWVPETSAQFRGGGPGGMMGDSPLSIINDANVIAELELVEDQVQSLKDLQEDMRNVFRESFSGMRGRFQDPDVDREALMNEIRDKIQADMQGVNDGLEEILLPHQVERLKELSFQSAIKRGGTQALLSNPKVKEELGLTDAQIEQVRTKAGEVQKEIDVKIKALRDSAQDEILSVLSSEQQSKIKAMLGDAFKFEERSVRSGRAGRGGRGGRGGERGGRGGGGRGGMGGMGGGPERGGPGMGRPQRPQPEPTP